MSENDPRFGYPIEYVKEHVLGCFEASKACAILPGKPHLYHVEFLKREDSTDIKDGSALPLDFYLQAHFSPCEEVTWYLHTRKNFPVYEGSTEADDQYVKDHEQGVIYPKVDPKVIDCATKLAEGFKEMYLEPLVRAAIAANSVPTTPENSTDSMTDTFGCRRCAEPYSTIHVHSRACKHRRSRFDALKEKTNGNQG